MLGETSTFRLVYTSKSSAFGSNQVIAVYFFLFLLTPVGSQLRFYNNRCRIRTTVKNCVCTFYIFYLDLEKNTMPTQKNTLLISCVVLTFQCKRKHELRLFNSTPQAPYNVISLVWNLVPDN